MPKGVSEISGGGWPSEPEEGLGTVDDEEGEQPDCEILSLG